MLLIRVQSVSIISISLLMMGLVIGPTEMVYGVYVGGISRKNGDPDRSQPPDVQNIILHRPLVAHFEIAVFISMLSLHCIEDLRVQISFESSAFEFMNDLLMNDLNVNLEQKHSEISTS